MFNFFITKATDLNWTSCVTSLEHLCSGSVWIASELKGLNDDCEHFEVFPPGHLYSSKEREFRRWYNPLWFNEVIPSTPYDPLALRHAFEKVRIRFTKNRLQYIIVKEGSFCFSYNWYNDCGGDWLQAVIKRLMTDVPFGVLLSGGLDSSLVASVTARHLAGTKAAKQWGTKLHSFCVGLEVCSYSRLWMAHQI